MAPVRINGKTGFIDKFGKFIILPRFDFAFWFTEGLAAVRVCTNSGLKWGFIDKSGQFVIEPQFDDARWFSEGMALVEIRDETGQGWYGFIDKSGKFVVKPQYNTAGIFHEGLAAVSINGKIGYIDKKGNVIIKPQFEQAWWFSEGLAQVKIDGRRGYINKAGEIVISPQFIGTGDGGQFHDGMALVCSPTYNQYYIDKTGKPVINALSGANRFNMGLAPMEAATNWKWGYINTEGFNFEISPQFDYAEPFSDAETDFSY
jgi:hypothetical protein